MKKVYYLKSCSTCQRIIKELGGLKDFEMQNIKEDAIEEEMLDWLRDRKGSYEALFSRRSMKYRAWNLHEKQLVEDDYKKLILEEYTFLKRPVIINGDQAFVGNTKQEIKAAFDSLR